MRKESKGQSIVCFAHLATGSFKVTRFTIIALAIGLKWMQTGSEEIDLLASQPESLPAKESYLDELQRLSELLDQGVITEDEFTTRKKQILSA